MEHLGATHQQPPLPKRHLLRADLPEVMKEAISETGQFSFPLTTDVVHQRAHEIVVQPAFRFYLLGLMIAGLEEFITQGVLKNNLSGWIIPTLIAFLPF